MILRAGEYSVTVDTLYCLFLHHSRRMMDYFIEHIYPQRPDPLWATENWPTSSDEQKELIENIGNYLLLNEEVNKRIKNKYIDYKITEYNRIIPSDLSLGTEMNTVDFERFKNERRSYIVERQKAITRMAFCLGSPSWIRTNNTAVNSRVLYR